MSTKTDLDLEFSIGDFSANRIEEAVEKCGDEDFFVPGKKWGYR